MTLKLTKAQLAVYETDLREFNRRMKKLFDEKGIEIPFPHRTLYFANDAAKQMDKLASV